MTYTSILTTAQSIAPTLTTHRRTLHRMPEIAYHEHNTSKYIQDRLDELGIEYTVGFCDTAVTAIIRGSKQSVSGKTVLLRADMDALPIAEQSNAEYASTVDGMMHACGHDAHMACLLGAAQVLNSTHDELCGTVKLMFQPAEEGTGGAEHMVTQGVLENPKVDAAFALHVEPSFDCGKIVVKSGAVMAAPDEFSITIKGKGGHGGYPHKAIDPILTAAKVIDAIHTINSRYINASTPSVVSVCTINAGSLYNIIPDIVTMKGTCRAVDDYTRDELPRLIEQMTKGICLAMGADYEFEFKYMYPPLINDAAMTNIVISAAEKLIGTDNIEYLESPFMGGEDFSFVAREVPASYFYLGCRNETKGITAPLHNSAFNLDEDCLPLGAAMLVATALEFLGYE